MAKVNKPRAIKEATGLNKGLALAAGGDNVPAVIQDANGAPVEPAAIKEGEIIFSVEAVIGAGEGDYDKGAQLLLELHDQLKAIGTEITQGGGQGTPQGLAAAPPEPV